MEVAQSAVVVHSSQSQAGVAQRFKYKNLLQNHTQRSALPLPAYQTINEGSQHAPQFRSAVFVDGSSFVSSRTFLNRKEAEQDVARVALEGISLKIKNEGVPLINNDTTFCKSILHEFAAKLKVKIPAYTTAESKGLFPLFITSVDFNGETYKGGEGRNKREAEQLAARAAIGSILVSSDSGTVMAQIIKSKCRFYAALHKGIEGEDQSALTNAQLHAVAHANALSFLQHAVTHAELLPSVQPAVAYAVAPPLVQPAPAHLVAPPLVQPAPAHLVAPAPAHLVAPPPLQPAPAQLVAPPPLQPAPAHLVAPPPLQPAPAHLVAPPRVQPAPAHLVAPPPLQPAPAHLVAPPPLQPTPAHLVTPPPSQPVVAHAMAPPPVQPAATAEVNHVSTEAKMPKKEYVYEASRSIGKETSKLDIPLADPPAGSTDTVAPDHGVSHVELCSQVKNEVPLDVPRVVLNEPNNAASNTGRKRSRKNKGGQCKKTRTEDESPGTQGQPSANATGV